MRRSLFLLLLCACPGPRFFDCPDVPSEDLERFEASLTTEEREVWQRMDVHCVPFEDLDNFQVCGRSLAKHPGACTAWVGNGPYRGKCFADRAKVVAGLAHEARHWSPYSWACPLEDAHSPECFDQGLVDRSTPPTPATSEP